MRSTKLTEFSSTIDIKGILDPVFKYPLIIIKSIFANYLNHPLSFESEILSTFITLAAALAIHVHSNKRQE